MDHRNSTATSYPRSWWACIWLATAAALWMTICPPAEAATERACAEPAIEALPFEPVISTRLSHAELTALGGGDPLAGAVVTLRTAELSDDGCTLRAGWSRPVIYIAAELTRNRCAYDHVLTHELEHVRIYTAALQLLPLRIRALMHQGHTAQAAAEQALIEVRAQHAAHDSDEELATNRTACGRRIPRLLAGQ